MARKSFLLGFFILMGLLMADAQNYTAKRYIEDVLSGRSVVCKWTRLAVQRHVDDLQRVGQSDFPYHFDESQAKRVIDFIQELRHTQGVWANPRDGRDTRIKLEGWQQFHLWVLFGWRRDDNDCRRFTHAYVEVARKNGKTTEGAAIVNYCFFADRPKEVGPEAYFGATKQEQAAKAWREARLQIEKHPTLRKHAKIYLSSYTITIPGTAARMRPLGRDSSTEDGLNPSIALIDEYHAHPDSSLLDVLESGMGARQQPLVLIITTAGYDKSGPCFTQEHEIAEQLLEGSIDPRPEHVFAIIYSLDEGDNFADERVWQKANPNLGVSIEREYLRQRVKLALAMPAKANDVKTKNFNIWTQAVTRWITDEQWMACAGEVDLESLKGRPAYLGMDLSSTQDLTSVCLCFPPRAPGELWKLAWKYWIPEDGILEHIQKDKVPYDVWIEEGLVVATPGDTVDYDWVEGEIAELAESYDIQEVAYDPWKAAEVVNHLQGAGLTMVPVRQAFNPMALYSDALEKKLLSREIAHGGNAVARWNMACVEMKSDRQGNVMPMKPKRDVPGKRIDGIVAAIMAVGRAVVNELDSSSVYEGRGIITL